MNVPIMYAFIVFKRLNTAIKLKSLYLEFGGSLGENILSDWPYNIAGKNFNIARLVRI